MEPFKDNFSKHAKIYSQFRPSYPAELFRFLQSLTAGHALAWDCGTGNGQAAVALAEFYKSVYATDPSAEQIANAQPHPGVTYKVEKAEACGLPDQSADLITIAQALHWFDFDRFYAEARRVLKPDGIIAAWAYKYPHVNDALDPIISHFHNVTVDDFWAPENRLVEKKYATIPFPFEAVATPSFAITLEWSLDELLGHFRSWSATQKYIAANHTNPLVQLEASLSEHWPKGTTKEVIWEMTLKVGRVTISH